MGRGDGKVGRGWYSDDRAGRSVTSCQCARLPEHPYFHSLLDITQGLSSIFFWSPAWARNGFILILI